MSKYISLISEAIAALKSRTGSSRVAIRKQIEAAHPEVVASPAFDRSFRAALAKGVESDVLVAVTSGSFKRAFDCSRSAAACCSPLPPGA